MLGTPKFLRNKKDARDFAKAVEGAQTPSAEAVTVEAGTDGLDEGNLQDTLQALASRIAALETP